MAANAGKTIKTIKAIAAGSGRAWALAGGVAVLGTAWWVVRQRHAINLRDKVVVITGGSRGLGLCLARRFADRGAHLALIARDIQELTAAQNELRRRSAGVMTFDADLTCRERVESVIQEVVDHFGRIDVLVNNAGVITVGPMENMSDEDFERSLATHILAPLFTTLAALPHLKRRRGGRVVNISSIGGKLAVPHLLPYCTGKFGLTGLSDGLRVELRRYGIRVTTVCPGLMRTGSPTQALFKGRNRREYAWFVTGGVMPGLSVDADVAARRIVKACRRGDARLVLGIPAKLASMANALAPELTTRLNVLVNRLLPDPLSEPLERPVTGWDSRGLAPSLAEKRREKAGRANNETQEGFSP